MSLRRAVVATACLAVLAAWFAYLAARMPFNIGDEGYLFYLGWAMGNGQLPYRDFELSTYTPGLFAWMALAFKLFGANVDGGRVFTALLCIVNVLLIHAVVRELAGRHLALVAAAAIALAPGPWHVGYVGSLGLACLWFALRWHRLQRMRDAVGLGIVLGLGLQIRLDVAVAVLALTPLAAWRGSLASTPIRHAPALAAAMAAMLLPILVYLAMHGLIGDYLQQLANYVAIAAERSSAWYRLPPPSPMQLLVGGPGPQFARLYYLSILQLLLAGVVALSMLRHWWQDRGRPLPLAVIVLVWLLLNFPQHALERPDDVHLYQRGFAFVVASCFLLGEHGLPTLQARTGHWLRVLPTVALILFVLGGLQLPAASGPGSLAVAGESVELANGNRFVAQAGTDWPAVARSVLAETTAQERIAVVPFGPGLNFLTQRYTPGRKNHFMPNAIRDDEQDAFAAAELDQAARVALQPGFQLSPVQQAALGCYAPRVAGVLNSRFRVRSGYAYPQYLERSLAAGSETPAVPDCPTPPVPEPALE